MKRLVQDEPELRFQYSYDGIETVLEGEELQRLLSRFFWHNSRLSKCGDPDKAFVLAVIRAYQGLYDENVVFDDDLRDLATGDARKMDLLYKGLWLLLLEVLYPGEDWEKRLVRQGEFSATLNEILSLKPSLFGIGIDINAIIRRRLSR